MISREGAKIATICRGTIDQRPFRQEVFAIFTLSREI